MLDRHYQTWREARAKLNELPLSAESWKKSCSLELTPVLG
jgi:hypothetical protein